MELEIVLISVATFCVLPFQLVVSQDYDVADISCSFGRKTVGGEDNEGDDDPEGLTALLRDKRSLFAFRVVLPQMVSFPSNKWLRLARTQTKPPRAIRPLFSDFEFRAAGPENFGRRRVGIVCHTEIQF